MVKKCEIIFKDNSQGVFYSGQILEGYVELTLDKPKPVRALTLDICGWAEATWQKEEVVDSDEGKKSMEVTYTGKEEYVSSKTRLLTAGNGKEVEIPKGTNVYNFQCFIPEVAPTSFEGTLGFIRYTVSLNLDRPLKRDESFVRAFSVIRSVDLNESPTLKLPCQMERIKTFCCWPCGSDPVIMTVQIPMSGYVAGQQIEINIDVNNQSRIDINDINVVLQKNIVYSVRDPKESSKSDVVRVTGAKLPGVKAHSTFKDQRKLEIPPISPTDTSHSSIIHQSYELLVTGKVGGCHGNPTLSIPITIGTVPLFQSYASASAPTEDEIVEPQAPLLEGGNVEELQPPSYEECMAGGAAIAVETKGGSSVTENKFCPRYPVYDYGWNLK